jgi:hypothetical protein
MSKHPKDMSREELREVVSAMSWAALDLAQHLNFTNEMLKPEFREEAYKRAERMAGELSSLPYAFDPAAQPNNDKFNVVVLGANGLERL